MCKVGSLSLAQLRRALVNLGLSGGQREVRDTPDGPSDGCVVPHKSSRVYRSSQFQGVLVGELCFTFWSLPKATNRMSVCVCVVDPLNKGIVWWEGVRFPKWNLE